MIKIDRVRASKSNIHVCIEQSIRIESIDLFNNSKSIQLNLERLFSALRRAHLSRSSSLMLKKENRSNRKKIEQIELHRFESLSNNHFVELS